MSFSDSESGVKNNMNSQKPLLRVWEGDFGIPSLDTESLKLLTYLKINRIDFDIEFTTFPFLRPIPSLKIDGKVYDNVPSIWQKLKLPCTDQLYDMSEQCRMNAYMIYIFEYLHPALTINLWIKEHNYIHFTKAWYKSAIFFPFNIWYVKKMKEEADKKIEYLANDLTVEAFSIFQYEKAKICFSDLSIVLGDKMYFMGEHPTTLDAHVYGYLCPLLFAPFHDTILQNTLKLYPNLVEYLKNITENFFPDVKMGYKYIKKRKISESDDDASTSVVVVTGILAVSAMFAYALMIGQFKIQK